MILMVDTNSIASRGFYGRRTEGDKFQFFNILTNAVNHIKPDTVYFMFDGKPYLRQQKYPEYKADRTPDADRTAYIEELHQVISNVYGQTYHVTGYEADDLIASAVRIVSPEDVYILSGDRDLWRLISYRVKCIYHNQIIDAVEFYKRMGFYPEKYSKYKAFCGDKGDNLDGVRGVGDKWAKRLIDFDVDAWDVSDLTPFIRKKVAVGKQDYLFTLDLVTLDDSVELDLGYKPLNIKDMVDYYVNYQKQFAKDDLTIDWDNW